ncbi:putative ribonuclease H-like domain-containing protein [Tanacetum coccineum]
MSETEPIVPTSSVTALRIPIIKKGEYDLWSMKMRQYIAITDHILWTYHQWKPNHNLILISPPLSAPKTIACWKRNKKTMKSPFGGNEASKKMQKNLLKQQFETFTIGSREELDSAYERFQHILSMLELHEATVSIEDANLKFLRSLPSVWHVVATMIRGQPGLDELDFDDLYNNLKVYEHELKGVSNSNSQNIAFLSAEVKGSTLKQSTAEPAHIPKGYTQAISSKAPTAPNCASHSDEIICSFFAQQASMPTTHDDEDLLQIDEDAMEEIDIRWQVAMITARIRKFMRKTGRSIDLKPKNGITFDKSKIECFNCQKLGHFARECRFAKYQENRANGRNEKRIVAIEDSNSKALVATDNNEDIDWTKEFDAEPVTYAMMALTGVEQDDWSIEFDAEHMHFGQDGLDDFDWSNKADDAPVSLALMATNSEDDELAISDDEETVLNSSETQKKTVFNSENSETSFENSPNHLIKDCNLHERTFKQTQTHKPKGTQGSRDTRPVWNNIQRVTHSNFSGNSRYPHQRRSFIPSAVLTREGLKSTARPRVPQAVLSQSTGRPYHPRMDNIRPRTSSFSPSSRSSTTRTPHRPQRPKKIVKSIWVKKGSTVGSQAVLPQTVKKSAMIKSNQTWRPKGAYLDSVNRDNGSYTLKQFEYGNPEEDLKDYAIIDSGCLMKRNSIKTSCIDFEKVSYVEELTLDSKNIIPSGGITCLVAKATKDEAVLWHRRLGHVNFKNINKLVKGNLVRGLPSKTFKLDHSCLACRKGKQHRASCKKIEERTVREPLELLHMDLFGPVSVESVNRKKYCLVVTDDCSKFSWVFFLAYKDETYDMLHDLIVGLENKLRHKVKTIRCDHGTEFKNQLMNEFCAKKGIKREYSIARTPQQNGVAERKNRTLIEAARTMLADSLLPIQFWAEAVNTACYVLNRVLVTKPQMKTPYEILMGRSPNISFMRPFGCPLTILNTLDHLGKFDGKSEEGYLLGYSTNSKGFRVYNRVTRKVQDCLHVNFLENQENQKGKGPDWMFDLELLTPSMNYIPVRKENYADSGGQETACNDVEDFDDQQFIVHGPSINPVQNKQHTADKEVPLSSDEQALHDELVSLMHQESLAKIHNDAQRNAFEEEKRRIALEKGKECVDSTFTLSTANTPSQSTGNTPTDSDDDVPKDGVFSTNSFDDENTDTEEGGAADYNNMDPTIDVTSTPTLRIHKIHPQSQIIGKSTAGILTRRKLKESASDQHQALLEEPKKVSQALADESWVEAMQEELLQFKLQEKKCMSTASRFDRSFASKTRRGAIDKTLFIKKDRRDIMLVQVYVDDIIFGSTKSSMVKDFEELMQKEFKMSSMGELTFFLGLQVKQTSAGIFLSQDKYVKDILNKFDFRTIKPASTPIEAHKSLGKDEEGEEVDVHLYRSMIGCLMYLTASRPDIMFAVCLCARFQVTPKVSHIHAVKRIFRYLKHQPKLGLWYPKDSPFHLEAFSDSDYAGDNHDRRSTSGGCQYLGRRLVSWQCKKQTIVAISSTEAEYVAAASCCAQVLWMQNQLLDYGFNFMNTEIHIDNESTICIVKNPVFHSKTKHIQIRHHFIRDCYEQRLINVVKVHTDDNVADLLTKGFDLARFNFLVVTIGSLEALSLHLRGGYE